MKAYLKKILWLNKLQMLAFHTISDQYVLKHLADRKQKLVAVGDIL